ncbi:MAG: hypothetical protein KIS90_08620, partial [Phenylobacterium sp.]|nr:hypothetical protein [Phenylobacterium sp.]
MIQIEAWEGNLHVGLSSDLTPPEYRFQGGLNVVQGFYIDGRVVAPARHRGDAIRVWIRPFGTDVRFGPGEQEEVGQIQVSQTPTTAAALSATLLMPEGARSMAAVCLEATWRYLHLWTFDEDPDEASIN